MEVAMAENRKDIAIKVNGVKKMYKLGQIGVYAEKKIPTLKSMRENAATAKPLWL